MLNAVMVICTPCARLPEEMTLTVDVDEQLAYWECQETTEPKEEYTCTNEDGETLEKWQWRAWQRVACGVGAVLTSPGSLV